MRILVVEDERKVANALREGLEAEQYHVTLAHTGEERSARIKVLSVFSARVSAVCAP